MSEFLALALMILLFILRFVIPILVIWLFGRLLDHIYTRWQQDGRLTPKN